MQRSIWELIHPDGRKYLTREVLAGVDCLETHDPNCKISAFLHTIHSPDGDRHMHNHPWEWAQAYVLSGGYKEEFQIWNEEPSFREFTAGQINGIYPCTYHSIVAVLPNTTTLFVCGPEIQDWGFMVDGIHVPHAEYFKRDDVSPMSTVRIA